jgi:cytochrome P450
MAVSKHCKQELLCQEKEVTEVPLIEHFMSRENLQDPRPFLAKARDEIPIFRTIDSKGRLMYVLTRYDLVKECFGRHEDFSSEFGFLVRTGSGNKEADRILASTGFDYEKYGAALINQDDPVHKRRRDLVQPAFSIGAVNRLTDYLNVVAEELIDKFIDRGEFDVADDFAVPFAIVAILDMLGMDKSLIQKGHEWSHAVITRTGGLASAEEEIAAAHSLVEFQNHLRKALRERSEKPGEDLTSHVLLQNKQSDNPLSEDELLGFLLELFFAGNETSKTTIVAAMALMVQNPDQWTLLRRDPSLAANAADEILRFHSTGSCIFRIAARDTQIGGVEIPKGAIMMLRQDSANRDDQFFPDAVKFDITRKNARQHMTFGYGIHHCLGQALARRELVVALQKLSARLGDIRLVKEKSDLRRQDNLIVHILRKVTLSFTRH